MSIYTKPSFYALILNGLLILIIVILIRKNYRRLKTEDSYKIILLIILFNILIGVHGLLHISLERTYNYNPLEKIINKIK